MTVDPELVEAGHRAVAAGEADSLSGWVSSALSEKARRDRKLEGLRAALADYEAEFGSITDAEISAQQRADREASIVVRRAEPTATGQFTGPGEGRSD